MRGKYLIVAVAILVATLAFVEVKAVEDSPQLGLSFNLTRELNRDLDLKGHLSFTNLVSGVAPYGSMGLNWEATKWFEAEAYLGYGFEPEKENQGFFVGIDPTLSWKDFSFAHAIAYYDGFDLFFSWHSLNYGYKFLRIGVDSRNYQYLLEADEDLCAYQVGPSLKVIFSDRTNIKFNYYYSFENDGEDTNVFKMTLNFNF